MKSMASTLDNRDNTGIAILDRVLRPDEVTLTADAAQTLLRLKFAESDERRMNRLAAKARKGTLTEKDRLEIEQYNLVSHMLALLQAKARRALKDEGSDPASA